LLWSLIKHPLLRISRGIEVTQNEQEKWYENETKPEYDPWNLRNKYSDVKALINETNQIVRASAQQLVAISAIKRSVFREPSAPINE